MNIHFLGVPSHRLNEELVTLLVGKADELILNGRAITRTRAVDLARVERRAGDVFANDAVGLGVGVDDVAGKMRKVRKHLLAVVGRIGKGSLLAGLLLKAGKINGGALYPRGGAGLEADETDARLPKRCRKPLGGQKVVRTCFVDDVARKDGALEIGSRGHHGAFAGPDLAKTGTQGANATAAVLSKLGVQRHDLGLHETQIRRTLKRLLHQRLILLAVGLNALALHGRPLTRVEGTGLQGHQIGRAAHFAAQGVDLVDEMAFGRSADRGIAGQVGDGLEGHGKEDGVHAQSCRSERGLNACVSCADHGDLCG